MSEVFSSFRISLEEFYLMYLAIAVVYSAAWTVVAAYHIRQKTELRHTMAGYAAFQLSLVALIYGQNGTALWPSKIDLTSIYPTYDVVTHALSIGAMLYFIGIFLRSSPRWRPLLAARALVIAASVVLIGLAIAGFHSITALAVLGLAAITIVALSVRAAFDYDRTVGRLYLVGWSLLIVNSGYYALTNLEVFPDSWYADHAVLIGSIGEMAVFGVMALLMVQMRARDSDRRETAEQRQRLADFTNLSFDFFFEVDADGRADLLPERMAQSLDIAPDLFKDLSLFKAAAVDEARIRARQPIRGRRVQLPRATANGHVWISLNAIPALSPATDWRCACYNVTNQVDLESGLMASARLAELGEMAGSIAHEINNPLCIISNVVDNLDYAMQGNGVSESLLRDSFDRIRATIERIAKIVSSMLLLSREGTGERFQETSLASCLEPALHVISDRLWKRNVRLDMAPTPDIALFVNHTLMAQVILNILSNAVDALADTKGGIIRITTSVEPRHVRIVIENNGAPINPATADRIFDPFFTTKAPNRGTGLGLSVSRRIIEKHGGSLHLDQANGMTGFVVRLPRSKLKAAVPAAAAAKTSGTPKTPEQTL